jgi:tetratricopeptide (TPR) repeat protein
MYIGGGSYTYFADTSQPYAYPNNLLTDDLRGLVAGWGATVFAGSDWDEIGRFNSIHNNTNIDLGCYEYSYIEAGYNYWGGQECNLYVDGTSYIAEVDYYLTTDPWGGQNLAIVKPINNSETVKYLSKSIGTTSSSNSNLSTGVILEKQGRINDAINFYKGLIANDQNVRIALSQLVGIKYKYAKNEIVDYLISLSTSNQKYSPVVKKLLGDIYLKNNQFDIAIAAYDDVIKNYSTEYDGIMARFEKLLAYLHIKKDPVKPSQILSEIKRINSTDKEVQMMIKSVGDLINGNNVMEKRSNLTNDNIPKTYNLFQNYPNPFNPSTTIKYQIPKPGLVTLKVYDILGREVATLVNENKIEGFYDFTFDASRFASGVYIYQVRVNDFVSSKKMVLLK